MYIAETDWKQMCIRKGLTGLTSGNAFEMCRMMRKSEKGAESGTQNEKTLFEQSTHYTVYE